MSVTADWDLSSFFSSLDDPGYTAWRDGLHHDFADLARRATALQATDLDGLAGVLTDLETADARLKHLRAYLDCRAAADAQDEAVAAELASAAVLAAEQEKAQVPVQALLRDLDDAAWQVARPELAPLAHDLGQLRRRGRMAMAPQLETLAADLGVTGLAAWSRLYDEISGSLEFDLVRPDGTVERLPVARTRSLLDDADAGVRRAALEGSNRAWASVGKTVASALNGISGTRTTLYRWRKTPHFLDPALLDAGLEKRTLDAMMDAVQSRFELPRQYLREKARLLGMPHLGRQDVQAPLPLPEAGRVSWDEAVARLLDAFDRRYPAFGAFSRQALQQRWLDHTPRAGKRPGAFCTESPVTGEPRVFMTFAGGFGDLRTLAHELGHAWHAWVMRDLRPWQRRVPMPLAETASTFAEEVLVDAVLADPGTSAARRAQLLDSRLQASTAFLLDIPTRFLFEQAVYEARQHGELGASWLCERMAATQREVYGDALGPDGLDPWFWASKLHFYIAEISFYNFPYTFGYLFSQGLFARLRAQGPDFLATYEALLRRTGDTPAEVLVRDVLGVDIGQPAFWHEAIDGIEAGMGPWRQAVRDAGLQPQ